jgi:hypothetical protein
MYNKVIKYDYKEKYYNMKKTVCAAIAVIALGLCLVSCNNKEASEGNMIVSPNNGGYTFEVPASWEISHTDGMVSVYNPEDSTKANVTSYHFDNGKSEYVSSADYWEIYKAQFEDTFTTMNVNKVEETKISGITAQHVFYTVDLGLDSFNCQTVLGVYGTDVYVLTLTQGAKNEQNEDVYVDYTEDFKRMVSSFKIG